MTAAEPPHPTFRAGDRILDDRYTVVHKNGRKIPTAPAEPVDTGGAGTVYRVNGVGRHDRALKILTMSSRREDPQKKTLDYQSTFRKEQRLLDFLPHGNIVRLHEYGKNLQHENRPWEYHITEWVEGETLLKKWSLPIPRARNATRSFPKFLGAVRYMHKLGVAHGDIKCENIRCRRLADKTLQAVLLDLGSAQLFGENAPDEAAFLGSGAIFTSPNDAASDPDQLLTHSPFATTENCFIMS